MAAEDPIALKEVQLRLGVPQHVLIHLCEKGVIVPDFADTSGRGKRREFSQRNLFEFAAALALRKLELPVATAAFVIRLLRSFATATAKLLPGFALPGSLAEFGIELALHLYDGDLLVLAASGPPLPAPLLLGMKLDGPPTRMAARPRLEKLAELPRDFDAHLELDLTRIAKKLSR